MNVESIGTEADFVARVVNQVGSNEGVRPISLLVGSGVCLPSIPKPSQIVAKIRSAIQEQERPDFDVEISKAAEVTDQYQLAFQYLGRRHTPQLRDKVIQEATLAAYRGILTPLGRGDSFLDIELDTDKWLVQPGIEAIGRIWCGLEPRYRGPILTTNFDPLVEIAIRRAGGTVSTTVFDSDGNLEHVLEYSENVNVMHVHGFWRESQTLHTVSQLEAPRRHLNGSLKALLKRNTLVVVGYSGWNDTVMKALTETVDLDYARDLDILWCSYGPGEDLIRDGQSNSLLGTLLESGRVQFYSGCDSNRLFPAIEAKIADKLQYSTTKRVHSSLAALTGWFLVDGNQRHETPQLSLQERAVDFLDGREPTVQDAFNPFIAKRDVVNSLVNTLLKASVSTFDLLAGPSGEGKSMALFQVAAELSKRAPNEAVMVRSSGSFDVSSILGNARDRRMFLIVDNIDQQRSPLGELVKALNGAPDCCVCIVGAARDTDWQSVGGNSFSWDRYVKYRKRQVKGLSRLDATALVDAWTSLGARALGDLVRLHGVEERVDALENRAKSVSPEDSSLFGAALSLRNSSEGLRDHLRELLGRLADEREHPVGAQSSVGLAEVLIAVAVVHVFDGTPLPLGVLADTFSMSSQEMETLIVRRLVEEAPVSVSGDLVSARHSKIAEVLVEICGEFRIDSSALLARLVGSAAVRLKHMGRDSSVSRVAYISRNVQSVDSALAVQLARVASRVDPTRLSYQTRLSSALRADGRVLEALEVSKTALEGWWKAPDRRDGVRPALNELGVCFGGNGENLGNALFSGASLSDIHDVPGFFQKSEVLTSLGCVALAFYRLWEYTSSRRYLEAVGACDYLIQPYTRSGSWLYSSRISTALSSLANGIASTPGSICESVQMIELALGVVAKNSAPLTHMLPGGGVSGFKELEFALERGLV